MKLRKTLIDISVFPGLVDCAFAPTTAIETVTTLLPSREEWKRDDVRQGESIHANADGSELKGRAGVGVHSEQLRIFFSFRLRDYCSVFQAELMAMTKAVIRVQWDAIPPDNIYLFTDSQGAIKPLTKQSTTSKICRR